MQSLAFLAFCCGLFGVASQSLLLGECTTNLAGGGLWLSPLLGMWFLAGAVGVFAARRVRIVESRLDTVPEVLCLACVPVFCLQYLAAVLLVGADSIPPLHRILGWSLLIEAPGGLLAGLLLSALCRRTGRQDGSPISAACVWGAVGGVVGGSGTALLLYAGASTIQAFLVAAVLFWVSAAWSAWVRPWQRRRWIGFAVPAVCMAVVAAGAVWRVDLSLARIVRQKRWSRLVPTGTLDGGFRTAQAEYLHGMEGDRWIVVRGGAVHEVMGDRMQAGKIVAMALSQNFTAERILVIGDGLSVCERFLKSPHVKAVDWCDPDREYVQSVWTRLPESFRVSDSRLSRLTDDIRTTLIGRPGTYDVVVINLSRPIDGSLHRFVSAEFFGQVKQALRPLGVLVMGFAGDRNVPDGEPAYQGAWVESTLDAVFSQTLRVPDERRTFFVSAAETYLQFDPTILETRFGLIENAGEIFPVELLARVYRPDLALEMEGSYDAVEIPRERLVNHDEGPSHPQCGFLQAATRSGLILDKTTRSLLRGGLMILVVPIALLAVVRLAYVIRTAPRAKGRHAPQCGPALRSDVVLIGGCAIAVSVVALILLMQGRQWSCGLPSRHIGMVFSLFSLGLALGLACARWAVSRLHPKGPTHLRSASWALAAMLVIQAAGLAASGFVAGHSLEWPVLAMLLSLYGFVGGTAGVLAAKVLDGCDPDAGSAPAGLAGAGHLGAAAGCAASFLLMPLTGLQGAIFVTAVAAFANAVLAGVVPYELLRPGRRIVSHRLLTPVGYGLFAVALSIVAGSHILAHVERSQAAGQATVAIQDWVQGRRLAARTVAAGDGAKEAAYQEVREGSQLKGYIFRSEDFSNTVYGYGGPMSVVLFADPAGSLIDFRITRSYETPRYISRIRSWMESLKGHKVFGPTPMEGVNAVSGATRSCDAILRLLRNSGRQFEASVLAGGQVTDVARQRWTEKVDWLAVYWAVGIVLALAAIWHGRLWSRVAVLAFTAGVGGAWLNRQYSTDHVMRLLSGQGLLDSPLAIACLLLGVPLIVLLLGNVYCGYLCPFGAVQELLSFVVPKRFKVKPSLSTVTVVRFIKYAVLFALVAVSFLTGSKRFLDADPLTLVFNRQFWSEGLLASPGLITAVLVLAGALVVTRMWCRYLCPTGAFLSLFNAAGWLGRFLPAKKFGRCEFGLGGRDNLDCIHCDRCRYDSRLVPARDKITGKTASGLGSWALLLIVLCLAAWTLASVVRESPAETASQTTGLGERERSAAPDPLPIQVRLR